MSNSPATTAPTRNTIYNDLLAKWNASSPHDPECENCEADLTGCDVHETPGSWVCTDCAAEYSAEHGSLTNDNDAADNLRNGQWA